MSGQMTELQLCAWRFGAAPSSALREARMPDVEAELTGPQLMVLHDLAERGTVDIRTINETYRQASIDLAMMEPPLVDIEADWLFATDAGVRALRSQAKG